MPLKGTGSINPFIKRKPLDKIDRPPKKPKVMMASIAEETFDSNKLPHLPRSRKEKGLMTGYGPVTKK